MCVSNPNQAKLVALVFFAKEKEVGTFGQNSPIIRCQCSKIIFFANIKN